MKLYYFFLFVIFLLAFFELFSEVFQTISFKKFKSIKNITKKKSEAFSISDTIIKKIAYVIKRFVKIEDEYDRSKLLTKLRLASIHETPEEFLAIAFANAVFTILLAILFSTLHFLFFPIGVIASIFVYFDKMSQPDKIIEKKKEKIEEELPRFTNQISQELQTTVDVVYMIEKYMKTSEGEFKNELQITLSDMRTGNISLALTRLESRINSSMMSEIVKGLIGVLRGDDSRSYFNNLSYNFRQEEIEKLKKRALQIPEKINKYSVIIAVLVMIMFMILLMIDGLNSFKEAL
ncbi:MAG: hypothetical protein Q4A00_07950 [Flavobacteriaceae bacterium]|nr:hypothetical protein [Flavobacteriaceae bacterium]